MKFLFLASIALSLVGFLTMLAGWWKSNRALEDRGLWILALGATVFMVTSGMRELFPRW